MNVLGWLLVGLAFVLLAALVNNSVPSLLDSLAGGKSATNWSGGASGGGGGGGSGGFK